MRVRGSLAQQYSAPLAHASDWSKAAGATQHQMLNGQSMKRLTIIASPVLIALGWSAAATADGTLATMPHGNYDCSLPGDASGLARIPVETAHFRIASASSYRSKDGRGTYIMKGKVLTFTRGPKLGERYIRVGDNALQKLNEDGSTSRLLCTRTGAKF